MKYKIPFIKPHFPSLDNLSKDFKKIQENNWFTNFGPFEQELCRNIEALYPDSVHVTTIANASLGIQAAISVLMKHSDERREVLVPSFTFVAGPEILISEGLTPVLIDINPESLQPSIEEARKYISKNKTKVAGILLTNTFGIGNLEVDLWEELATNHGLPLVIDSAAGFGSLYFDNERVGSRGDCEIFSMHATKPFSVGEGGLVVSRNKSTIEKIRSYQNFGFNNKREVSIIGTNAKLAELSCAIGVRQLIDFEVRLESRRETLRYYKKRLQKLGFDFIENDERSTVCFASTLAPLSFDASSIIEFLGESGVEVRRYYNPVHNEPIIMDRVLRAGDLKNTTAAHLRIISLPVHDYMKVGDLKYVTQTIEKYFDGTKH